YFTSAIFARSAARAGIDSLVSAVIETLTSEVETTSTATLWRSKASKMDFKYPCTSRRRGEATSTSVIFFLSAMALKIFVQRGARAVIFVPSQMGFSEFKT